MTQPIECINRRSFVKAISVAATGFVAELSAIGQAESPRNIKLGYDSYSIRSLRLSAPGLVDYTAKLNLDTLFLTNLGALESFEERYLSDLKVRAAEKGIDIYLGSGSVCPSSSSFNTRFGSPEEHLALGIRMAKILGSPVLRVILGNAQDRRSPGGIEARIEETVDVCRRVRSMTIDAGIKLAFENHGDMQGWEIVSLVEAAGKDFVGITFDSGNAVAALEDPLAALEVMAPYIVATHLRDIMVWEYAEGARMQWCALGDGLLDWPNFVRRLSQLCPHVPVHFEIISGSNLDVPYLKPGFWNLWPKARAADFAGFVALAKRGRPREPHPWPEDKAERARAEREYQLSELEKSVTYAKGVWD